MSLHRPRSRRLQPTALVSLLIAIAVASPLVADLWYEHYQRGDEALREQDWVAASEELTASIELRAESAAPARLYGMKTIDYFPYYKLGIAFFNLGQYEAALQAFESELRFGAITGSEVEATNLEMLLEQAREAAAAVEVEPALRKEQTDRLEIGARNLVTQGRFEEAALELSRVVALDPSREDAQAQLEQLRRRMAEENESRLRRLRAAELADEGKAALERGEFEVAARRLDESLFMDPLPVVKRRLEEARAGIRSRQSRDAMVRLREQVEELEAQNRIREALELLQSLLAGEGSEAASELRERLLSRLAEEEVQRAREAEMRGWLDEGMQLFDRGRYESALRVFNRMLAADPRHERARSQLRRTYLALNRVVLDSVRMESLLPPAIVLAPRREPATSSSEEAEPIEQVDQREYSITAMVVDDQPSVELTLQRRGPGGESIWESDPEHLQGERLGNLWVFRFGRSVELDPGDETLVIAVKDPDDLRAEASLRVRFEPRWIRGAWVGGGLGLLLLVGVLQLLGRRELGRRRRLERRYNPFIAGPPVQNEQLFFGREDLIQRVLQTIHNNSVLLYGERRIGKTSLLHVLERRLRELQDEDYRFVPVYIDLQGTREERFFESLVEQLFAELSDQLSDARPRRRGGAARPYSFHDLVRDFRDVLRLLQAESDKRAKLVLLIDEVDELNHYESRTNQKLRSLFMKSFAENLVAVFAGVAIRHSWDRDGSPWYNFFEEIEVRPLRRETALALVEEPLRGTLRLEPGLAESIVDRCECKPYRIQKLCVALVHQAHAQRRRVIGKRELEAVLAAEEAAA